MLPMLQLWQDLFRPMDWWLHQQQVQCLALCWQQLWQLQQRQWLRLVVL